MPVVVDITCLCEHHTDAALEFIYKANSEDPPGDNIWDQHPSPFVRRIVELFTSRGLDRIDGLATELRKWLAGEMHSLSSERPPRPAGAMARWSKDELGTVKLYLENLPQDEFTVDDWGMLVDYLVQRYLPADDIRGEAEWLATRSNMMGRVQAAMAKEPTEAEADRILSALPISPDAAEAAFGMSARQRAVLDYGNARCCENVAGLSDAARHKMRRLIMDYAEAQAVGDKASAHGTLETALRDAFGAMNRDWRRIAVTEAGENLNQGFVASVAPGGRLKRVEKYRGACAFCRSIDGRIVTVVPAADAAKDGDKNVWVGKTNIGRSAAPRKRVAGALVEREPHERWWIAAGVQHPHCRGGWIQLKAPTRAVDPKFSDWMDEVLGRK